MKNLPTLSLLFLTPLPLSAQQPAAAAATTSSAESAATALPEMVVSGSATDSGPQSLTVPSVQDAREELSAIPGGTQVIDAETFRTGRASTLEDVFRDSPGVYSPERGSEGDEVKLSIRGSGLDLGFHMRGIKILQDGVPVNMADGFGDYQGIDPLSVRYIEVFRGSNALRYGATTLGGAVNFVSPTGYDADRLRLRFEGGSFDYYNGQISSGGVSGLWDYYVSATAMKRGGFQPHSVMDNERLSGNFGYRFSDDLETRFFLSWVRSRTELPGNLSKWEAENDPRSADPDAIAFDQGRDVDSFRIANKTTWRPDSTSRLESSLYYSHMLLDHPLFWNPYFLNALGVRYGTYNSFGGEQRYTNEADWLGRKNRFTLGFAPAATFLHDERLSNDYGKRGDHVGDGRSTAANFDLYAEEQHHLTDKLAVLAGASATYALRNFEDDFLSDPNGDQSRDQDYWGFSPKLGVLYDVSGGSQLFANVSRSFEPPTSVETVGLGGTGGNVLTHDIDAQTATTLEIGTRGEEGRVHWDLTYYYSWLRDELLTVNDRFGNPLGTINGPDTHHQGVELGLDLTLLGEPADTPGKHGGDSLTLKQVFNWSDFRFDDSEAYGGNRLAGAPEFQYRAELMFESRSGFYLGPNVQWSSRLPADYANTLYGDSYAILGLRAGYRSPKGWTVFGEARNLTDKHYVSAAEPIPDAGAGAASARVFRPGAPVSFYGGFEWKF